MGGDRWMGLKPVVAFLALLALAPAARADFVGNVVSVHDGDTMTVLVNQRQVKVRLVEIDAPELGQAFGKSSRQSLAEMCARQNATVSQRGTDRYNRVLGRVTCRGLDANAEQVRRGMAWVFVRYAPKGSALYAVQEDARGWRRGLWSQSDAVAPWVWRQTHRASEVNRGN